MIFTNGFPKTGNHALVKACELLGVPCQVYHTPTAEGLPSGATHHILVKRNPRNVVISMLRFNRQPVTAGTFLSRFRHFQTAPLVEEMAEFEGWLSDPRTLVIAYEDLIASDREMRRIAEHLGVPYLSGAFEELPGLTFTWNDVHSDWRSIWTPDLESIWNAEGGAALDKRWGYGA